MPVRSGRDYARSCPGPCESVPTRRRRCVLSHHAWAALSAFRERIAVMVEQEVMEISVRFQYIRARLFFFCPKNWPQGVNALVESGPLSTACGPTLLDPHSIPRSHRFQRPPFAFRRLRPRGKAAVKAASAVREQRLAAARLAAAVLCAASRRQTVGPTISDSNASATEAYGWPLASCSSIAADSASR